MFDAAFLSDENTNRAALNIGGIANITILPSKKSGKDISAYDTGPGNMIIDELMRTYFDKPFDNDGKVAQSGNTDTQLLNDLYSHPYFSTPPPKSTGRELFGKVFLSKFTTAIDSGYLTKNEAVTTATELTAISIAQELKSLQGEVISSGGGVKNIFLIKRLKKLLPNCQIKISDEFGIPSQAKEAIAFAYFAKAYVDEIPIHLPTTTGANKKLILGSFSRGNEL
jgi:anhydro-N-acetylmuramic acid kinase